MSFVDPMQAARLALLEGALLALLRAHCDEYALGDITPDGINASLDGVGVSVEYTLAGRAVAGEGL